MSFQIFVSSTLLLVTCMLAFTLYNELKLKKKKILDLK